MHRALCKPSRDDEVERLDDIPGSLILCLLLFLLDGDGRGGTLGGTGLGDGCWLLVRLTTGLSCRAEFLLLLLGVVFSATLLSPLEVLGK